VVAASERVEQAGSTVYHDDHMGAIFKEGFSFSGYERDLLAMNLGGDRFLDVSGVSGIDSISDGRGSVFADFDNDGDLDVFLTSVQREAHFLFRNDVGQRSGFIRVELEGVSRGRDAFGAVVRVRGSRGTQTRLKSGGSGYISHHDGRLLFGLGDDERVEWVEVTWPDGDRQRVGDVAAGSTLRFVEGREAPIAVAERRFELVDPLDPDEALLAGLGLKVGEPFPDLLLRGASEELLDATAPAGHGRRRLINLWATWCVPCAEEMPELQKLYPSFTRAGIDLIGISVDLDTVDAVPEFLRARGIDYPVYTTDAAALERLFPRGEATVPLTVLLDAQGRILQILTGWSERSEQALRSLAGS